MPATMLTDLGPVRIDMYGGHLLQGFRAAHAIAEAGATLAVTGPELPRYEWLNRYFHVPYQQNDGAPTISMAIDTAAPSVRLGQLERPLLFAHEIFNKYRACWAGDRQVRFWFAGHRNTRRCRSLGRWILANGRRALEGSRRTAADFEVRFAETGQQWPAKAWDADYAATLGRTQFALCPNGYYVWTYRFFEAAAAGAIPIVETYSDHYNGFAFYAFDDNPRAFEWTEAAAAHNAALAYSRLTAPLDEIAWNVQRELRRSTSLPTELKS